MYHTRSSTNPAVKRSFYLDANDNKRLNELSANAGITGSEIVKRVISAAVNGESELRKTLQFLAGLNGFFNA